MLIGLLVAGFLLAHAAIHVAFIAPPPPATADGPAWPFAMDRAWPVTRLGLDPALWRVVALALVAATIAGFAPKVPSWFPPGTGPNVGKTMAKAEIWQKPADFAAKAKAFRGAALAFNAAAKSGDMAAIKAGFGDLGKTCKACHDPYRAEKH